MSSVGSSQGSPNATESIAIAGQASNCESIEAAKEGLESEWDPDPEEPASPISTSELDQDAPGLEPGFRIAADTSFRGNNLQATEQPLHPSLSAPTPALPVERKGFLSKRVSGLWSRWEERWFYLAETHLYYFKHGRSSPSAAIPLASLRSQLVVPTSSSSAPADDASGINDLLLISPVAQLCVRASSRADAVEWVADISHNQRLLASQRPSIALPHRTDSEIAQRQRLPQDVVIKPLARTGSASSTSCA